MAAVWKRHRDWRASSVRGVRPGEHRLQDWGNPGEWRAVRQGGPIPFVTAETVSSRFSSITQCPAPGMITTVGLTEMSFICAPSAGPLALSPPTDVTGIESWVLPNSANSPAVFRNEEK